MSHRFWSIGRRSSRRPGRLRVRRRPPGAGPLAILLSTIVLVCAAARPAVAQDAEEEPAGGGAGPVARLQPLEVTVTRMRALLASLPYAVSVVREDDGPEGGRRLSLEETLDGVPGIFVQDRRNPSLGDRITIRGSGARAQFGVRGIQVIADGIPLTMPDGQTALGSLDLASAGRIELIRGPASALYGNAAGGVIDLRTKRPAPVPLAVESGVTVGSHGFVGSRVEASGSAERLGWLAAVRRVETDGFRDHSAAEIWNANLVGRYDFAPSTRARLVLNLHDVPLAENPSSLDRASARAAPGSTRRPVLEQGLGETHTQGQVGVSLRHRDGGTREITGSLWGVGRSVRNPIPASIIDISRRAGGLRAMLRGAAAPIGSSTVRYAAGIDAAVQADHRRESVNEGVDETERAVAGRLELDQRERVTSVGPFVQLTIEPSPRWALVLAGRYDAGFFRVTDLKTDDGDDSGSRVMTKFSPTAGVTFRPTTDLAVYASYATAFETPTTSELSNDPAGGGGFNDDLRPETLRSFELGARGRLPGVGASYELTAYRAVVDDALIPFQAPDEVVFHRNAGRVSRDGVELELGWRPHPRLDLRVGWTYQDFVLEEFATDDGDFSGNREPGVPRQRLSGGLRVSLLPGLRADVGARWVDAFPVDDANRSSNWSYRVVDARVSGEARILGARARTHLGVENLFGERYNGSVVPNAFGDRYYEPAPGREVVVGVRVGFPRS